MPDNSVKKKEKINKREIITINERKAVFISYIDLGTYIKGKNKKVSKNNIDKMIQNIKDSKFNTIYLQVRSHADSIYNSKIFPVSKNIILSDGSSYDVLKYFIEKGKKENISIYAWLNPYRIGEEIDKNSKYYKLVGEDGIKQINNMYYFNPASQNVEDLIVEGIKEILNNYKVDGIIFDDYFYPSSDIDKEEYEKSNLKISREQYHLDIVSKMILAVNKAIKKIDKKLLFGVAPDGNIDNNYQKHYADVKKWASDSKYIDFLMPQVYYGFNNSVRPYQQTIEEWNKIITDKSIGLDVALSFYKVGVIDNFAKEGRMEWIENRDIIKRQVQSARKLENYQGFSIFRYDSLFNKLKYTDNTIYELEGLKEIM